MNDAVQRGEGKHVQCLLIITVLVPKNKLVTSLGSPALKHLIIYEDYLKNPICYITNPNF